jgi:hypothetical protein
MSFDTLPQVDGASMNDDRAKNRLVSHFNRSDGFIAHEQVQDLGCDYKIELIEKGATNWSFDIQLKSIEKPRLIMDGQFLSFSLRTTTLKYLCNNAPIYGLLVIYDVSADICYFEYIDALYFRLLEEREGADWQHNKEVSVHVPKENVLNVATLAEIRQKFLQRFRNLGVMNSEHGASYGLPHVGTGLVDKVVIMSVEDALSELKANSSALLMRQDMRRVYQLLETLPANFIITNKEVLLVASVAYNEVGRLADSMYYIGRLSKRYQLEEDESRRISYISLKNELGLGEIDRKTFVAKARLLLQKSNFIEGLSLRINILYFELGSLQGFEPMSAELVNEYEVLQEMISSVGGARQQNFLKARNMENLAVIVSHCRSEDMNRKAIFDQLGMEMEEAQRKRYADKDSKLYYVLHQGFAEVGKYAFEKSEFVLLAAITISNLKFWLDFQMDVIVFGDKGISMEKSRSELDERIDIALETSVMMKGYKLFRQAYMLQCLAFELLFVSREWYGFDDRFDLVEIIKDMNALESDLELSPFVSQMQVLVKQKRTGNHHGLAGIGGLAEMSDGQIMTYARYVLESRCYPNAKLENIIKEMTASRTFHKRNADGRFELFTMKPADRNTAFVLPSVFCIKDTKTGIESLPVADIDTLLTSFGI